MSVRKRLSAGMAAFILVLASCGSATVEGPDIPVQDPALVALGEPLYEAGCAECHGIDLRGTDKGPSHLSIVYAPDHHNDFAFVRAIQVGSPQHHWTYGPMDPVPGLTDEDVNALIAFVRESQRLEGYEPYPPPE